MLASAQTSLYVLVSALSRGSAVFTEKEDNPKGLTVESILPNSDRDYLKEVATEGGDKHGYPDETLHTRHGLRIYHEHPTSSCI